MLSARIEMLQPILALITPRPPQSAEPVTFARARDACGMKLGQPARQGQFLCARRKMDEPLEQLPG